MSTQALRCLIAAALGLTGAALILDQLTVQTLIGLLLILWGNNVGNSNFK